MVLKKSDYNKRNFLDGVYNKTIFKYQRNFKFFKKNYCGQLDMSICIFQILQKESGLEIE